MWGNFHSPKALTAAGPAIRSHFTISRGGRLFKSLPLQSPFPEVGWLGVLYPGRLRRDYRLVSLSPIIFPLPLGHWYEWLLSGFQGSGLRGLVGLIGGTHIIRESSSSAPMWSGSALDKGNRYPYKRTLVGANWWNSCVERRGNKVIKL